MILSAHQPAYLPWLGYFDKLVKSDVFIYLDSVQFEKNSFINRNQIKSMNGALWLTIPVKIKGHINKTVKEIEIDNTQDWRKKHLNSIYYNYKKAINFEKCFFKLEKLFYSKNYVFLSDLCWDQLLFWLEQLKITKKIIKSSDLNLSTKKSDFICDLCKLFGADQYLSGKLGINYLKEDDFRNENIKINYQHYEHPVYNQQRGDFIPNLSIIDFWMNSGDIKLITQENKDELFTGMGREIQRKYTP